MKTSLFISLIGLSLSLMLSIHMEKPEHIGIPAITDYQCPPYHEETRPVLDEFLTSERFLEQRERMGLRQIALDEISYLEKHESCKPSGPPGPYSGDYLTTYYKSNEYYFRVNYFRLPNAEKVGNLYNFDTRSHSLMVHDKNFEGIGGVLF